MNNESFRNMKANFFDIANFSNVIGLVGDTQIRIIGPQQMNICMYAGRVTTPSM